MKKLFISALIAFAIALPLQAKYITPLSGPGVEITRVFIHRTGAISLYISGETENQDKCTSTYRVYIPHDLPGKDLMLSIALTAKASGQKVGFHGSGCSTTAFWGGTVDVPIVDNMWMF